MSGKSAEIMRNSVYAEIYREGYRKGEEDERKKILGNVDFKVEFNARRMRHVVEVDAAYYLTEEQIVRIMLEQLKEKQDDSKRGNEAY